MGTKKQELESETGCLAKAADDEPLFILRAQDRTAPILVRQWAKMLRERDPKNPKIKEAEALADSMVRWPTRKLPD